jgi:thiamine transport system ATP-binding protein
MAKAERRARAARVAAVLDMVGMRDLVDRRVATLSGGEQQRVALARALAVEPRLLMLDEPLGALDRMWRTRLLDEIRALLDAVGLAAVYVTHDHDEAFAIASRVAVMRAGRVVQVDAPAAVWRRPADPWTAQFLGFGPVTVVRVSFTRERASVTVQPDHGGSIAVYAPVPDGIAAGARVRCRVDPDALLVYPDRAD